MHSPVSLGRLTVATALGTTSAVAVSLMFLPGEWKLLSMLALIGGLGVLAFLGESAPSRASERPRADAEMSASRGHDWDIVRPEP